MINIRIQEPAAEAAVLTDLVFPEQVIIWSMRRWSSVSQLGRTQAWLCVEATLSRACGGGGDRLAAGALDQVLLTLAHRARGPFLCHGMRCPAIAPGERALIDLIAASQLGDRHHAERAARRLLPAAFADMLLENVAIIGAALELRFPALPPRYAMGAAGRTLH
ncbi:MAG: hypothetical protein FJX35_28330 [Alphaproteobacteria bacterium]|nr:hypothetical protein [Alphaproteobacteria bacterium]